MLSNSDSFVSKFTFSLALAISSFFLASFFLTGSFLPSLSIPFGYTGDSLLILDIIKRVVKDNWYFFTDKMGFPFGSTMYDYPVPDFGSLIVLKIIGKITGSYVIAHNLYFLLGFSVTAVTTYLVLLKMKLNNYLCIAGALLFDFVPFHFMRLPHLFYTWYFVAPIFFYYCIRIFSINPPFFAKNVTKKANIIDALALLILSFFGVYYAFFGALLVAVSGCVSSVYNKSKNNLFSALLAITIIFLGLLAINAPNIYYKLTHDKNTESAHRLSCESEIYALKITPLLMPHPGHRLKSLSDVIEKYNSSAPLVGGNYMASLGFIGSLGFILSLIVLLFGNFIEQRTREVGICALLTNERLKILSLLVITMILFMTVGGFSSLFAQFITPNLRGWDRVSIFIAFASFATFLIGVEFFIEKLQKITKIRYFFVFCSCAFLVFGLWDQTIPFSVSVLNATKISFLQDENFVQKIEKSLPKNSAVFQFPYMQFPEAGPIHLLAVYRPLIGYLHSENIKWSHGVLIGSAEDHFFKALSEQPLARQIDIIKKLGFAGIYVDRKGYVDNGAAFERELQAILKTTVLFESEDKFIAFYKLPNATLANFIHMKPIEIMKDVGFVADKLGLRYNCSLKHGIDFKKKGFPDFIKDISGLSGLESWGRWTDSNEVKIVFYDKLPKDFTLVLKASAFGPNVNQPIKVFAGCQEQMLVLDATIKEHRLLFRNNESNELMFFIPKPTSPAELGMGQGLRKLGIGFERLSIE